MKKLLIAAGVITLLSFAAEKTFTIKFTEGQLNKHWQKLNAVKQIVDNSNLGHQEAKFITLTIDSLQMELASQVNAQLAADTTKPKK